MTLGPSCLTVVSQDHPDGVDQRGVAEGLLRQVDRRLPRRLLLSRLHLAAR